MPIDTQLRYASVSELFLDPLNPRLGRANTGSNVSQPTVLDLMKDWSLEELAVSFLENGFWPQEALLVVEEYLYGATVKVVIEGNRRLAALKYLQGAVDGSIRDRKWVEIAQERPLPSGLFDNIPYLLVPTRKDVAAFLGFRHVTGIKEWKPAEKAEYIARLIEENDMDYVEVMRKIGSKTSIVRQNYISYRLLLQMEDQDSISISHVEDKFSVLYLSLRTDGVQKYLEINIKANPQEARKPVPADHLANLERFAKWLFGTDKIAPVVNDSRRVDDFGRILESEQALSYLERTDRPSFDVAFQLAGGDEPEIVRLVEEAADNVEAALSRAHRYTKSKPLRRAAERLGEDCNQLVSLFPGLREQLDEAES